MTNPVKAGCVESHKDWSGLIWRWPAPAVNFEKPKGFFQEKNTWSPGKTTDAGRPAINWLPRATLRFTRPRGFDELSDSELDECLDARIAALEASLTASQEANSESSVRDSPNRSTRARHPRKSRRQLDSKIRCSDPTLRAQILSGLRQWRCDYKRCLKEWPSDPTIEFPYGTHQMRAIYGVNVAEKPI